MWNPSLSIKATLLAVTILLVVLVAALVGANVYNSWMRYQEVRILRQSAEYTDLLYHAEMHLSRERGVAVSVLFASRSAMESLFEELKQNRREADVALQIALDIMKNKGGAEVNNALLEVQESYRRLQIVRDELDEQRQLPLSSRSSRFSERYFTVVTKLTTDIGKLISAYTLAVTQIDAIASQQIRFKHIVWEITEFAGREYAVIGNLIATGEPPSQEMLAQLQLWRGSIEYGWNLAQRIARRSQLYEELKPYIEEAETHYFVAFDQTKDMFYLPGDSFQAAAYPVSFEIWIELATQAVDSLMAMNDAALVQSLLYITKMEKSARRGIAFSVILFICALALSFYSGSIVIYRVARPVNYMADVLYRAIHGETFSSLHITQRYDEIGKLASVLEAFQEKAEEEINRKNYLKTVLATIVDSVITINSKGIIQTINPATEKMFGYQESELLGRNVKMIMPDFEAGKAKIRGKGRELEALRKDGSAFPIELSVTEMRRGGERVFVGMLRDITERKAAENKIVQYLGELEKSNRELDDFAYIASHDLKEPLRGLHNFSAFLIEDYEKLLDEEGKKMLRTIGELTQKMDNLLNSLLHYSRLGRTELSIRETDINELVESVLAMFAITIQEKGARVDIPRKLPVIVCDHVRIHEVFQNLIGNALKYNDKEEPIIEIGFTENCPKLPGKLVFYVKDNGIGIAEKNFDAIFKIFRRLHPQHAYGGGTGSGLTIAKKIIAQHGGQIWAESEGENKGATFYFYISPSNGLETKQEIKK